MSKGQQDESASQFEFGSSIPVLRMFDEAQAKAFFIDYLGFQIDWEHRFRPEPTSPLYMQISHGKAVLHLNGHAEPEAPVCEVRIPVRGLDAYCEYLRAKDAAYPKPSVVDPRYQGKNTDMNIIDPFGNCLVFWLSEKD